jgi:sulfoxide reductase heme-binding subunit YedZ
MPRRVRIAVKVAVWVIALLPLSLLIYRTVTDQLGANPISYATNLLGDTTLRLLLASLAMTPLRMLFGIAWQMTLRRLLGLLAFFYACLHFLVWVAVDHFFEWQEMIADVVKRPYITVGLLALTLLTPLAATSTAGAIKRMGAKNWRRLHRLVYVIGVLGVLHYLWLAKKGVNDPFIYAGVLALLLGVRLWDRVRRAARRVQQGSPPRTVSVRSRGFHPTDGLFPSPGAPVHPPAADGKIDTRTCHHDPQRVYHHTGAQ